MRKILFTSLVFTLLCTCAHAQINTLPTIDDPQDADRIQTYTRGFAAAFRLDSLKSYFQDGLTGGASNAGGITVDTTNLSVAIDTNLQGWINKVDVALLNARATGIRFGAMPTITGPLEVTFSAGAGQILDNTDAGSPVFYTMTWPETSVTLTITNTPVVYWMINSSGSLVQQTTPPNREDARLNILLGRSILVDGQIVQFPSTTYSTQQTVVQLSDLANALGLFIDRGCRPELVNNNLTFLQGGGELFKMGGNYANSYLDPNVVSFSGGNPANFRYFTRSGSSIGAVDITNIDPNNYDLNGTLTSVPNNLLTQEWTVQYIYIFDSDLIRIQYGQRVYNSKEEAFTGVNDGDFIANPNAANGIVAGALLLQRGATDLTDPNQAGLVLTNKFGEFTGGGSAVTGEFVQSVTAADGIEVNNADPANPIVGADTTFLATRAYAESQPGQAATITVGPTTTGDAGTDAVVTNSGDQQNAVLNFQIPRGVAGAAGADGQDGAPGADGLGWTSGAYDPATGVVTFASDDGLGFATGDLRGADGEDGAQGPPGDPATDDQDLTDVLQQGGSTPEPASFTSGDFRVDSPSDIVKRTETKVYVSEDCYSVDPTGGTGWLILRVPSAVPDTRVYYFDIEIKGYSYSDLGGFKAQLSGYFLSTNDRVYNLSKNISGLPGGIRTAKEGDRLVFVLGDGNVNWSEYRNLEVVRWRFDANTSTYYDMADGWSYSIETDESNISYNENAGFANDQSPFSSAGIASGSDNVKTYHNVVCNDLPGSTGFLVLEIPNQGFNLMNGEIVLQHYNTSELDETASTIQFSILSGFSGNSATSAVITGDIGSNVVSLGNDIANGITYVIIGDGTDEYNSTGFVCLDRFTASGNRSGNYSSSRFQFTVQTDLSYIPEIRNVEVVSLAKTPPEPDGNGLYSGDGNIPLGTRASGLSYPGAVSGDARLEFGEFYQSGYNTRFYAFDRVGYGVDQIGKINSSGDLVESYQRITDRSTFGGISYTGKGFTFTGGGYTERGLDLSFGRSRWLFGTNSNEYYEAFASSRPSNLSVFATDENGDSKWLNDVEEIRDMENNQSVGTFPAGNWVTLNAGSYTLENGGKYAFKMECWYSTSGGSSAQVRFVTSGGSISGRFVDGEIGVSQAFTGGTAMVLPSDATESRQVFHGKFTASSNSTLTIQARGVTNGATFFYPTMLKIRKIN